MYDKERIKSKRRERVKKLIMAFAIALAAAGCSTVVPVSGREINDSTLCSRGSDRYDGCFWNDRLWEEDWLTKKDTERTLKIVRTRIKPWQSIAAVFTIGIWVPVYVEWELNGVAE